MAYTPPNGNDTDFEFLGYTPPAGDQANFDFSTTTPSEIDSEIHGKQEENSEISSEIIGKALSSDILSEIIGGQKVDSEISSEIEGVASSTEILSEIIGIEKENSEISSEIIGIFDLPKRLGYRIIIKDKDGNALGELDSFRSVRFGKRLNNYGHSEFDIRVGDSKAASFIDLRKNTVEIYREYGLTNTLVWAGEQASSRAILNPSRNNWATVHSFTWFEQLFHRFTPQEVRYDQVDQGEIAEDMINVTNGESPTKITIGTIVPTFDRDRSYYNQNIGEAIINLSNVIAGFDFEVTDLGAFNADSIIGQDKTEDVIFKYGHNITNVDILEDFNNPVNRAIVLGEAIGEDELQRVDRNDAGLQAEYRLREGRLQEMDVSGMSTLEDKGDAAIRKYGLPLLTVEFDLVGNTNPSIDQFTVGDGIRLIIKDGIYNIDEQYRVFEWEVTFDSTNTERLKLTLGKFIL